jgi:molybdopterin/thiamine biosynthesis adenylyltransferase
LWFTPADRLVLLILPAGRRVDGTIDGMHLLQTPANIDQGFRRPVQSTSGSGALIRGRKLALPMAELNLDAEGLDRYARHVVMDDVGPEGQARLLDSAVLVVGAGGLGSPVVQYLATAGVGTLGIADPDAVERSNLQRQVIHGESDVGRSKVDSARAFVADRNPDVDVDAHETRVTAGNVEGLLADYDVVVDATDNFATRYLLNDACALAGVPLSQGSVLRFEGQVTTFPGDPGAPCYRCVFPEAPPEGTVPDCATAGVLGVLPGTIGCIQATETAKQLLGIGESLSGRLVHYDALDLVFETVPIQQAPDCPVCGEGGIETVGEVTYEGACSIDGDR